MKNFIIVRFAIILAVIFFLSCFPVGAEDVEKCFQCHNKISEFENLNSLKKIESITSSEFVSSMHVKIGCTGCHSDAIKFPHDKKHGKVNCSACHSNIEEEYSNSVHGKSSGNGDEDVAKCIDCHGYHNTRSVKDIHSPIFPYNLPLTCGKCHDNTSMMLRHRVNVQTPYKMYVETVHGKGLFKAGLLVSASCKDCHGVHNIKKKEDVDSLITFNNIPKTCGKCHIKVLEEFKASVHGQVWIKGGKNAPTCVTCHLPHQVVATDRKDYKLSIIQTCGSCHRDLMKTYRSSYHGKITSLGFVEVADCVDCHHYHNTFPGSDPRSITSQKQILATCRKCHPNATTNTTKFLNHADPHNRHKYPQLFYVWASMNLLLFSVFTFFGIHTVLWLIRGLYEKRKNGNQKNVKSVIGDNKEDTGERS